MEQIRAAEPPKLFVGADGPRADHPKDERYCEHARAVATQVDWDCEVHTLFRDENLGCKQAVSSAITWFFEHVEAGIILEDDCVPHSTFFPYCGELLETYQSDERVMAVSGNNFQPPDKKYSHSYYFSVYMHCWGWATWASCWSHYDDELPSWGKLKNTKWLEGWLGTKKEADYWQKVFKWVKSDAVNSWAYPWMYTCWKRHGLTVLPNRNLVKNIGFGERGTHTNDPNSKASRLSVNPISLPLQHPNIMVRDYEADRYTSKKHFGVWEKQPLHLRLRKKIPSKVKRVIKKYVAEYL